MDPDHLSIIEASAYHNIIQFPTKNRRIAFRPARSRRRLRRVFLEFPGIGVMNTHIFRPEKALWDLVELVIA